MGFLVETSHVKSTGRTPHQDATGTKHNGIILKFAEAALFKHPMSASGHMTGGRRRQKSRTTWEKGVFFGKTYESDEFLMGTSGGVHLVRTVRRLPVEDQVDLELVAKMIGVPWDRGVGQIGRPKGKKVVVVPAVPKPDGPEDSNQRPGAPDVTVNKGIAEDARSYVSARSRAGSAHMDVGEDPPAASGPYGAGALARGSLPAPGDPEVEMEVENPLEVGAIEGYVVDEGGPALNPEVVMNPDMDID